MLPWGANSSSKARATGTCALRLVDNPDHDHASGLEHTHPAMHDERRSVSHTHEHGHAAAHMYNHGTGVHRHGLFGRPHSHLPAGEQDVTIGSLLTLGVSGGILPCPSALVVLLSAIALHRVGFGLLLIVAFSLGLAGVLTGIGLLLAYARRVADRLPIDSSAVRVLPVLSAGAVALMGVVVTVQSLAGGGIIRFG